MKIDIEDFIVVFDVDISRFEEHLLFQKQIEKSALRKALKNWIYSRFSNNNASFGKFITNALKKNLCFILRNPKVLFRIADAESTYFYLAQVESFSYNYDRYFKDVDDFKLRNFSLKFFENERLAALVAEKNPLSLIKFLNSADFNENDFVKVTTIDLRMFERLDNGTRIKQKNTFVGQCQVFINEQNIRACKILVERYYLFKIAQGKPVAGLELKDKALERRIKQLWLNRALLNQYKKNKQKRMNLKSYHQNLNYLMCLFEAESLKIIEELTCSHPELYLSKNSVSVNREELLLSSLPEKLSEVVSASQAEEITDAILLLQHKLSS